MNFPNNNNNNVTKQSNQWHIFWTHWRERKHNLLNPASLLSRIVTTAPPLQPCGALRTDAREMVSTHTSTTPVSPRSPKRKHHLKHLSFCSNGASSNATYTDGSVGLPLGHRPSRPGSAASAASSSTPCLVLPPQQESMGAESPLLPNQPDGRGSALDFLSFFHSVSMGAER